MIKKILNILPLIILLSYTIYTLIPKDMPITSLETKPEYNLTKIVSINGVKIPEYQDYLFIKKPSFDIVGNCTTSIIDILFFKELNIPLELFKCKDSIIQKEYVKEVGLTVQEARVKYNLNPDVLREASIHFSGFLFGMMLMLVGFGGTTVVYLMTHKAKVLLVGIFISIFLGVGIGLISEKYNNTKTEVNKFYEDLEKQTGEKIIRNYDFF